MSNDAVYMLSAGIGVALVWYATTPLPVSADMHAAAGFALGVIVHQLLAIFA